MSSPTVKIEVQNTEEDEFVDVCSHADENSRMSMATTASSGCGSSLPSTEPADESSQSGKKFENFYQKFFQKKIQFFQFFKKTNFNFKNLQQSTSATTSHPVHNKIFPPSANLLVSAQRTSPKIPRI